MGETFWEPLVELHVILDGPPATDQADNDEVFCLCSRAIIFNPVHQPFVSTNFEDDNDEEYLGDKLQDKISSDISSATPSSADNKQKTGFRCAEPASCYGSGASEDADSVDAALRHSSDSGADVGDGSDVTAQFLRHWAEHGPQIVWQSWREKYADFMDPAALAAEGPSWPQEGRDHSEAMTLDQDQDKDQFEALTVQDQGQDQNADQEQQEENEVQVDAEGSDRLEQAMLTLAVQSSSSEGSGSERFESAEDLFASVDANRLQFELTDLSVPDDLEPIRVGPDSDSSNAEPDKKFLSEGTQDPMPTSSTDSSSDSMTDVTRLSSTSAELSLSTDSREEDHAEAWQAEWDRHCAALYAREFRAFVLRLEVATETAGEGEVAGAQELLEDSGELGDSKESRAQDTRFHPEVPEVQDVLEVPGSQDASASDRKLSVSVGDEGKTGAGVEDAAEVTAVETEGTERKDQAEAGTEEVGDLATRLEGKREAKRKSRGGSQLVVQSVGVLLRSLAGQSEPVDAEGGGAKGGSTNQKAGSKASATAPTNHRASTNEATGSGGSDDDPPERLPVGRNLKRAHEEEADSEPPPIDTVDGAVLLLGLATSSQSALQGRVHLAKRSHAIQAQNRWLRVGPKQTRPGGDPDETGSSVDPEEGGSSGDEPDDGNESASDMEQTEMEGVQGASGTRSQETKMEEPTNAESLEPTNAEPFEACATEMQDSDSDGLKITKPKMPSLDQVVSELAQTTAAQERCPARKRKQRKKGVPPEVLAEPALRKFWNRRFQLFSRFSQGIRMDAESWYSVTPEKVAQHLAERCQCDLIVDAFCGAGGNAIQFAFTCQRVIAVDIDPAKLALARHNAGVYGVADRIEFLCADFTQVAGRLRADAVFLSPPWGGLGYRNSEAFGLDQVLAPVGGLELFRLATLVSANVAYYLPKNTDTRQVISLGGPGSQCEIEQSFLDRHNVALTAYYGDLVRSN